MNTSPLVSILVPIYNVELYIVQCARSLFEQSYTNCEYIFVDDSSPDGSMELLEALIEREYDHLRGRITIAHHPQNQGVAVARNRLLELARGEYITFVDPDDWIEPHFVERCMACEADVVQSAYTNHFEGGREQVVCTPWVGDNTAALRAVLGQSHLVGNHLAINLIRRAILEDNCLRFERGVNMAEDYSLLPRLLYYTRSLGYIKEPLYNYRRTNVASCTSNVNHERTLSYLAANRIVTQFIERQEDGEQYRYSLLLGKLNIKKWIRRRGFDLALYEQPLGLELTSDYPLLTIYNLAIERAPLLVVKMVGGVVNLPLLIRLFLRRCFS